MEVLAIVIFALVIGSLFFFGFKRTGPWGSFWSFILILFLGMWIVDIWVSPYGPQYYGIAWLDLLLVGLLLAFLLAAATPTTYVPPEGRDITDAELVKIQQREMSRWPTAIGVFFWIMLLFFISLVLIGIFA